MIQLQSCLAAFGTGGLTPTAAAAAGTADDFAAMLAALETAPASGQAAPVSSRFEALTVDSPEESAAPLLAAVAALPPAAWAAPVEAARFPSPAADTDVKNPSPEWSRPIVVTQPRASAVKPTAARTVPVRHDGQAEPAEDGDDGAGTPAQTEAQAQTTEVHTLVGAPVQQPELPRAPEVLRRLKPAPRPMIAVAVTDRAPPPAALLPVAAAVIPAEIRAAGSDAPGPVSVVEAIQVATPAPGPLEAAPTDRRPATEGAPGAISRFDSLVEGVEAQLQELDALVRDISEVSGKTGRAAFRLAAEQLGSLEVRLHTSDAGVAVNIRADSEQGHLAVSQAQRQLSEDLRANGLRVAETSVGLGHGAADRDRSDRPTQQAVAARIEAAAPEPSDPLPDNEHRPSGRYA